MQIHQRVNGTEIHYDKCIVDCTMVSQNACTIVYFRKGCTHNIPWYKKFVLWWYEDVPLYSIAYHGTSKLYCGCVRMYHGISYCTMVQVFFVSWLHKDVPWYS